MRHKEETFVEDLPETFRYSRSLAETLQGAKKILLVEDDVDQNLALALHLRSHGYEVMSVFDGIQGLEKGALEEPDLILLDLRLPRMNGLKLLHQIRMNPSTFNTPIVVVTGDDSEKALETTRNWGVKWYFRKPVNSRELTRTIDKILDGTLEG